MAAGVPEGFCQHFRAETRSTHSEQHGMEKILAPDIRPEVIELAHALALFVDDSEPAEPAAFVGSGPERSVARPKTPDIAASPPLVQ